MLTIFKRLFRDRLSSLVLFSIIGMLFILLYFLFYPIVMQNEGLIRGFMESMPKVLLAAFGILDFDIFSFEGFLTYKHYNVTLPVLIIILLAGLAGSSISGEIEKGTIETPLACPVSRLRMFFGIYTVGILSLLIFVIIGVISVMPLGSMLGIEYVSGFHFQIALLSLLFGWAVFSLSLLISTLCSQVRRAYTIIAGLLIVMYLLYMTANMVNSLVWLKYFSIFGYFEPNIILHTSHFSYLSLYVYSALALVCTALGACRFCRRDICL